MELTDAANEFVGSSVFIIICIITVIVVGFILRLTFKSSNSEYKHKPDE